MNQIAQTATMEDATPLAMDAKAFRAGMARLAAAVNVITTAEGEERYGFTASAVCSVTDAPPTLLVCVNRTARSHPVIARTGILCVNTLASAQEPVGMAFAGSNATMEERFATGAWSTLVTGAPALDGAAVSFDCRVSAVQQVGSHDVLFCEVLALRCADAAEGLVYFDRRFHALS